MAQSFSSPRRVIAAFVLFACSITCVARAQATGAEIQARLVGKPLYLRGLWRSDKLKFDAAGTLKGKSETASFTISGIDIESVQMDSKGLRLLGRRVGLVLTTPGHDRVPLLKDFKQRDDEDMQIDIEAPRDNDYNLALSAIFTEDLADFAPSLPEIWQSYVKRYLLTTQPPAFDLSTFTKQALAERAREPGTPPVFEKGGAYLTPKVLRTSPPEFSEEARRNHIAGQVLLSVIVGADGAISHPRIEKAAGFGLDEQAIAAVQQYRFSPATENGSPVPVLLSIEVDFSIY